jgi:6-phosphogluconate dehydrogenase
MKLTEAMRNELAHISRCEGAQNVRFQTGEALRRRGLAERFTLHVIKAEYVSKDASTDQGWATRRKPVQQHEWYITNEGYAALQREGE